MRVEGIGGDLGQLTAGGRATPAEIRPVPRVAWLAGVAAGIAVDDAVVRQPLDGGPEGIARLDISKRLLGGRDRIVELRGDGGDFGDLAAGGMLIPAKVGPVLPVARLIRP